MPEVGAAPADGQVAGRAAAARLEAERPARRPRRRWAPELAGFLPPTALGAVLVLHALGSRSLWLDEADTFATASQRGPLLVHAALNDGGNMFLYYLSMHYWTGLFGASEFSMRMISALAAIATVPVCFYFLKRLFDWRAGVFGAFFVAVSLPFVWWAQTARAYMTALCLVCASMLAFVLAVQTRRRSAWAAYAVLTALAAYTIVLTPLVVVAQATSLLLRRKRGIPGRALLGSAGGLALLVVPLAWVVADHGATAIEWVPPPGRLFGAADWYLVQFLASSRTGGVPFSPSKVLWLTVATLLCWALGLGLFVRSLARGYRSERSWAYGLLWGWLVLPPLITYLISVAGQPVFADRYILVALPPASMMAGVALSRLRPWPVAVVGGLGLLALRAHIIAPSYGVPLEDWRQGVIDITAQSQPHDCVAFFAADGFNAFDYYVRHLHLAAGTVPTSVLPASSWLSAKPYVLDPAAIPPARMPAVVASCARLWLVRSHDAGLPAGPGARPYLVRVELNGRALTAELDRSYTASSSWAFPGAQVSLYVRRP